jgi:Domain of unknown function (DUF4269)
MIMKLALDARLPSLIAEGIAVSYSRYMERPHYCEALRWVGVMSALAEFDPHLAGTLPLGVNLPTSDLDILCHAIDPDVFATALWATFGGETDFSLHQWIGEDRHARDAAPRSRTDDLRG